MLQEIIDGYRRTAVKSRHLSLVKEKAAEYEDRGYKTEIHIMGGYHHLYVKKDIEDLGRSKKETSE